MTTDDYCDFCDLPMSQCVHGRPPAPPPAKTVKAPAQPRKRAVPRATTVAAKPVVRRWTQPEAMKPLILDVLQQAGGEMEADDLFVQLEVLMEDRMLEGDHESTPEGELRWRYAARRARVALIEEGTMVKTTPGVWRLA